MSNLSLISPWHSPEEDEAFLILLKRGDLIEFDRGSYSHWAVYLGMVPVDEVAVEDDDDGLLFSSQAMVVHRANPGVQENGWASWTSAISKSSSGGGEVCFEKLSDVWGKANARVNNGLDSEVPPFDEQTIVDRAISSVGSQGGFRRYYNLLTNNCEHFVTWIRNGWAISEQVTRRLRQAFQFGAFLSLSLVPRPLLAAAGVGYVGALALRRREERPRIE